MSVGERLRRARLDAGKTLDQVAAETKIQLWILEAIERDDLSRIPGGVFIRGYLTAIARAVRVEPSEILAAYAPEVPPPPVPIPPPGPPPDLNERPGAQLWQYVVIVAIVMVAAVLWRGLPRGTADVNTARTAHAVNVPATAQPASPPPTTAAGAGPTIPPGPAPTTPAGLAPTESGATATTGASSPAAPAEPNDTAPAASGPATLVLELHAKGEVWIEATADGEQKAYQLLEEGQNLRLEAQKEIRLLVGDAAAVTYTINGKPGRPLGGAGDVRQFVVSPGTVESLTAVSQKTDG